MTDTLDMIIKGATKAKRNLISIRKAPLDFGMYDIEYYLVIDSEKFKYIARLQGSGILFVYNAFRLYLNKIKN